MEGDLVVSFEDFSHRLQACYNMGKRLRTNPLFRQKHPLTYKRKSREEARTEHMEETESATSTTNVALIKHKRPKYAEHSIVDPHPVGSERLDFYHSWPRTVILKNAPSERAPEWKTNLSSKFCHFCGPLGKCSNIKELIDHLYTHHPNFIYKALQNVSCTIITMYINKDRENNIDPLFIVGSEGCMMSSKKLRNCPFYCGTSHRGQLGYPFVLYKAPIPKRYDVYKPGAPGTIDAQSFNRKAHGQRLKVPNKKRRRTGEEYECLFCWKDFPSAQLLERHIEMEHQNRKYKCTHCEWRFTKSSNLTRHMRRVHNGKKRFQCKQCYEKCAQKATLNLHVNRAHKPSF